MAASLTSAILSTPGMLNLKSACYELRGSDRGAQARCCDDNTLAEEACRQDSWARTHNEALTKRLHTKPIADRCCRAVNSRPSGSLSLGLEVQISSNQLREEAPSILCERVKPLSGSY